MPPGESCSCSNSMSHKNKERKMTGKNAADQPPVSKLNTIIMAKFGRLPSYKLEVNNVTAGMPKFMWRITCPISSGGETLSIVGPYGRTKKEAKHHAAEIFLKKFLDKKVEKRHRSAGLIYQGGINLCCKGRDMLEHICSKINLGRPEYAEVKTLSCSSRSTHFKIDCMLGNLRTRGKGKNRIAAKLHATARMMQVLMGTPPIRDVLKSGPMTMISNNVTEIVCSSQPSVSSILSPNLSQVCEQPEPHDVPVSIQQELESNPVMSDGQGESIENSGQEAIPLSIKHEIQSDPVMSDVRLEAIENSEQGAIPLSIIHEIQSDPVMSDIRVEAIENSEQGAIPLSNKHEIQSDSVMSDVQLEAIENSQQGAIPLSIKHEIESDPVMSDVQLEAIENSEHGAIPLSIKHEIESDPVMSDVRLEAIENSEQGAIPLSIKHEMESDPVMSDVQVEAIENSQQGTCDQEPIYGTMLNNNQWHCANSQLQSSTSLYVVNRTLTRLQAISQIDRMLGNCEKQLYDKILEAVSYSNVPYYRTVSVLCHDYQVFIQHGEPLRILKDGTLECCDQSIRVACLTKILLDLKQCIITNPAK